MRGGAERVFTVYKRDKKEGALLGWCAGQRSNTEKANEWLGQQSVAPYILFTATETCLHRSHSPSEITHPVHYHERKRVLLPGSNFVVTTNDLVKLVYKIRSIYHSKPQRKSIARFQC